MAAMPEASGAGSDAAAVARENGLRYVTDSAPGIRRVRRGRGFVYLGPGGERIEDPAVLRRIRALVIPPAWTHVWIAPSGNAHIQATGRDARGRKQYRYHERWRSARDTAKYESLEAFAAVLPGLRTRVAEDMALAGLPREKVLATAVALIEATLIRVGNDEYVRANGSFGLTTLRCDHVEVRGEGVSFVFTGKSGKAMELGVRDRRIARVIRRCQELPGQELLQYRLGDGGDTVARVTSEDVNDYLREVTGAAFTARTFRTWGASVLMSTELATAGPPEGTRDGKRTVTAAIKRVAARLGNTPAVCRSCYVHPAVIEAYEAGTFPHAARRYYHAHNGSGLGGDERFLLRVLAEARRGDNGGK
jgi:DNA topoisomerase-1